MFKGLASVILLLTCTMFTFAQEQISAVDNASGFNEDYFVGLKAFDDGLNDIALISLKDFLAAEPSSKQAGFATYLVYQLHLAANDYANAKRELANISKFNDDPRFDKKKMANDSMFIETKTNCGTAKKMLLGNISDDWLKIYAASGCSVDSEISEYVVANAFAPDSIYLILEKIKGDKKTVAGLYEKLKPEQKTPKLMNFYGYFFAMEKMRKEFWVLYNEYKDADLVTLALADIWDGDDFTRYTQVFASDVKPEYKLESAAYCRMIEASNKTAKQFDCSVIDGCLSTAHVDFKRTKLACYMKNEDKAGIDVFMQTVSAKEAAELCEYGKYIIGKQLYNISFVEKFTSCPDKKAMFDALYGFKDHDAMLKLAGKMLSDQDKAYAAIAYHMAGKKKESADTKSKITDTLLLELVNTHTGG